MTKKEILMMMSKIACHLMTARALAEELHSDMRYVDITCDGEMFDDDVLDVEYAAEDAEGKIDALMEWVNRGEVVIEECV